MTTGALLLLLLTGSLYLVVHQIARISLRDETVHADSYVLYDILHFQKTGVIYRDLSQPPYLPAVYSPLVYMMYALPSRIAPSNPFLGPRLAALAVFLLCVATVVSIVRALIPARHAWLWGLLLACSINSMAIWPILFRGDFPGILFSLVSIRLLLTRSSRMVPLAGLCAGFATQFKITFLAAIIAGSLWLLLRKQWKGLAGFLAAGVLTSAGLYLFFWMREPRMLSQILSLAPPIRDVFGCAKLIATAFSEPVVLLALAALPLAASRAWPRWRLLLLFALVSFSLAGLVEIQALGDINYFFEGLFAVTPLAVLGAYRLIAWSRARPGLALFVTGIILIQFLLPSMREMYWHRSEISPRATRAREGMLRDMEAVLRGHRVFSSIPRIALIDPQPALLEPVLLTYLRRLGKFDGRPILDRIRNEEFDVVITDPEADQSYRGFRKLEGIEDTITSAYVPGCAGKEMVVSFPRTCPPDNVLIEGLRGILCVP